MRKITQFKLKELLDYDEHTGLFTWKSTRKGVSKIGAIAGYVNRNGYRMINVDSNRVSAHRLAFLYMNGKFPASCVDHINGIRDDNRWENLKEASYSDNNKNKKNLKLPKSGIVGVRFSDQFSRWIATIGINGRQKSLGRYKTLLDASCARRSAEIKHSYSENHGNRA